ncbi:MAG: transposase family protein [Verrucomicrobiota bacterium]
MLKDLQSSTGASARALSPVLGLDARRLRRWQQRAEAGEPVLRRPGPQKTGPLPLAELRHDLEQLRHGRQRSHGVLALQERYRPFLSRRDLAQLVATERAARELARQQRGKRVQWHEPDVVWGTDASERGADRAGRKLFVHTVQDLCTRYRFAPLVAVESQGRAIARHLAGLFRRYGPPLFLKRDNGGPFNHAAVDAVLAAYGVIPLNSPVHYPQYNGAVERGIRDLQQALGECLPPPQRWHPAQLRPYLLAVNQALNCRRRRSLHGQTACEAYAHRPRHRYNLRARHAIFALISLRAKDSISQLERKDHRSLSAAWRHAAEAWLVCQGLITVSSTQKSVTLLS